MSDYANNLSNELLSFKKSIASNNREAIDKYLSQIKNLSEDFLNQALFWCIENYKVEQQTDQCLHILLRYSSQNSKSKANPNCEINLQTPLIAACRKGQLSLVKRLIQNGAKPDLTNSKNQHPLEYLLASRQQNYDVADYLVSQMQSVNFIIKNKHPILISVQREFYRIFKTLLDKGSQLMFEEGNLLHFILKQKFKNTKTKKKFLKQLTTKHNLFTQLDKNGKIPIDYEQNEEIKAYYLQNFKVKKAPEPLINSVQKSLNNNSSIFISTKSAKRDTRPTGNEKRKNLYDSNSFINKPNKQTGKDTKVQSKETKQDEVSFEEQIDDKSEGQLQQEEKYPQKISKTLNQSNALTGSKKITPQSGKSTHNASFISNYSTNNYPKQSNASTCGQASNSTTANKAKSKYSNIGPKTQTNLRNAFVSKKYEAKKPTGFNTSNNQSRDINSKKKGSFEDEKKQMGSSKKIPSYEEKNPSSKDQIKISKEQKCEQNQKTLMNEDEVEQDEFKDKESQQIEQVCKQVEDILKKQSEVPIETLEIRNDPQIKLPQKQQFVSIVKKSQWQIALESCEKLMEQFIIKEEHQITDLKQLKAKFNELFCQYKPNKSIICNEEIKKQSEKLKQLKIYNNEANKSIGSINSKPNVQKQFQKQHISDSHLLNNQILIIESTCTQTAQKKTDCIREAINFITKKVHNVLQSGRKDKIQVSIETYGSRANGLEIQTSDTDLLIICNINEGVKDLMLELERSGAFNCNQINEVKYLTNTSMPIMKLSLNSEFMHMNIDLTFQIRGHTGIRCTSLIKQFIAAEQLLKPLVVTLKSLLNCYELCDTYTGGVGSYSLTLMTIALLQFTEIKKTRQNLGEIFLQFLLFYGFQMDYICQAIIIHPPGFNERPAFSIYQLPYSLDLTPKLIIYDPLNPVNNVGRATYRIVQLKKLFKIWYVKLRTQLSGKKDGLQQLMKMKNDLLNRTSFAQK